MHYIFNFVFFIMTSVRLPNEIENRLDKLCQLTHRSKSFYIKEALACYLDNLEDNFIALERIASTKREFLSTDELLKELDK